jgi:hypothetical protein
MDMKGKKHGTKKKESDGDENNREQKGKNPAPRLNQLGAGEGLGVMETDTSCSYASVFFRSSLPSRTARLVRTYQSARVVPSSHSARFEPTSHSARLTYHEVRTNLPALSEVRTYQPLDEDRTYQPIGGVLVDAGRVPGRNRSHDSTTRAC